MKRIHFIGIGGVGMNGLAQLAVQSGYAVTGSDRAYKPQIGVFELLEAMGIQIFPQDGSGIDEQTDQVVFSTAIEADNPDLKKAEKHNISLLHRAAFLDQLIGDTPLIAVAGTAGKTTTTGILGWIFECLGKDPSVYNGAAILNWKNKTTLGNVRKGNAPLWIIEADESDRSFLRFHPTHAIITNISKDHYELDELHQMFDQFRSQIKQHIIEGSSEISQKEQSFIFENVEFTVPLQGKHNIQNAHAAVALCHQLGFNLHAVRTALAQFKGIERRLETVGEIDGVRIIDDYAHNPAKIAAALEAASAATAGDLHAYWRPHGFTPLHQNLPELIDIFTRHWKKNGGTLFILPVFYAGGTTQKKTTSNDLVAALHRKGVPANLVVGYDQLRCALHEIMKPEDTILGMGARDPQLPIFAQELLEL